MPCTSSRMFVTALRPYRRCRYPYDAYFAEGTLYLSPACWRNSRRLWKCCGRSAAQRTVFSPEDALPSGLAERLMSSHVLKRNNGVLRWIPSIHAPYPLTDVKPMSDGDWYI